MSHTIRLPPSFPPTHSKQMSKTDFKGLFAPQEYRAISTKAETDDIVFQFWDMAQTADSIDVNDSRTQGGMGYLVSVGCLTQERHDVIMLGKPL